MTRKAPALARVLSVLSLFITGLTLLVALAAQALGQAYSVTRVTMPDKEGVQDTSMNASGQITGYYTVHGGYAGAFFWSASTGLIDLGTLGGMTYPGGINDSGEVTGASQVVPEGEYHTFLWTQAGGMQDLGIGNSSGNGINDSGQVVGTLIGSDNSFQAFLWDPLTGLGDIGTSADGSTFGSAINNGGEVAGSSQPCGYSPFTWTATGGMQQFLGCTAGGTAGVNDSGDVIGTYVTDTGATDGYFWSPSGGLLDIGGPIICCTAANGPSGINDNGQVVGNWRVNTSGQIIPFVWSQAAGTQYLQNLVAANVQLYAAGSINKFGQITAWNAQTLFLLTPKMNTAITSSSNPSYAGQAVTFTATVGSTAGPPPDSETVTFYDGPSVIGTGATANGVATFTTSTLSVKTRTIQAIYSGDATYAASSGTVKQVVHLAPTTTAVSSSLNPSTTGQAITFTATVISSGPETPTGNVTFKNGTTGIGTAALIGGSAMLTKSNLGAGTHPITALYDGDSDSGKSTSLVLEQVVQSASATASAPLSLNPKSR